jgi:hypothetical protein
VRRRSVVVNVAVRQRSSLRVAAAVGVRARREQAAETA